MALSFSNDDRASDNKCGANPVSPGQAFTQEERSQNHCDHDAEFVDGGHFGSFAELQCSEIAEPGCAGSEAGKYQKQPGSSGGFGQAIEASAERDAPCEDQNHDRADGRGQIGVNAFDAPPWRAPR